MSVIRRFGVVMILAAGFALGPAASAARAVQEQERAQAGLVAEIEEQLDKCRDFIRSGQRYREALDLLSPLTARVFTVADRSRQMALAVEIFLLKGIAHSGTGNDAAAVREFRSMFELNPALARQATKNIYDAKLIELLRRAEGREAEPEAAAAQEKAAPVPEKADRPAAVVREAAPPPGLTLVLSSDPPGAEISIDGAATGKTD